MFTIVMRAIIIYLIVLIVFRLMGKRQLGQMQPFELVLTLIIADLATIPMADISIPVLHGIVPLLTLVVIHFFLTILTKVSTKLGGVISGKPVIVINPDGIDYKSLKKLNITIDDLFEAVRGCGYFSLEQIQYAIMETNGSVNVLPKADFASVTIGDMKIKTDDSSIPVTLVSDGKFMKENATLIEVEQSYVEDILKGNNILSIKECLIMTIDSSGQIYLQGRKGKFIVTKVKKKGLKVS